MNYVNMLQRLWVGYFVEWRAYLNSAPILVGQRNPTYSQALQHTAYNRQLALSRRIDDIERRLSPSETRTYRNWYLDFMGA